MKTAKIKLGRFREDPDNVSEATDEEIKRLAGKLKRVPLGLTAMRIAYVTDAPGGGCMVISGNKRLRVLKQAYGEDGEVPAEWFADVTAMSEAERHEFRLNANVSDGHWNLEKLLDQYGRDELTDAGLEDLLKDLSGSSQPPSEDGSLKTDEYDEFVDKFKPKLTTDDCYTPEKVFDAVQKWAVDRYGLAGRKLIRPFRPGGDYEHEKYPDGCVVLDNPPFSILSQIVKFYLSKKIDFFLYGPALTLFSGGARKDVHYVLTGSSIIYHNGAVVRTGFVTNMGDALIEVAPDLRDVIKDANCTETNQLPKYEYPMSVATSARLEFLAVHGVPFKIMPGEAAFVRKLDSQGDKTIFGGGFIISVDAEKRREQAEKNAEENKIKEAERRLGMIGCKTANGKIAWMLSERESELQKSLVANGK